MRWILTVTTFLMLIAGCHGRQPIDWDHWQLPNVDESTPTQLRDRARLWDEWLFDRHISPEGLLLYRIPSEPDPVHGDRFDLADQACWSGYLLAAIAFHYSVEPSPEVLDRLRKVLRGLVRLHEATGVPGLIARCLLPAESVADRAHHIEQWRVAADDSAYWCRYAPSKDQYSGYVFGVTAAAELSDDPEVREQCGRLLVAIATNLIDGKYRFRDHDGHVPRFGDIRPRIFGYPIGVNAVLTLAILESAREHAEPALRRRIDKRRDYARRAINPLHQQVLGFRNYNNAAMGAAGMLTLALLAPPSADQCARVRDFDENFYGEGNALFVSLAALHGVALPTEVRGALRNLLSAPIDLHGVAIGESTYAGLRRQTLPDRRGKPLARNALPLAVRPRSSFAWRSDPHVLDRKPNNQGELRLSAVDFYLAYWLGRYAAWIPAPGLK